MPSNQLKQLCAEILETGRQKFGLTLGIVSRIHSGKYEIFAVSSPTGIPEVGDEYGVNSVYCREVVQTAKTVAITEIKGVTGMRLHPLYDDIPCEAYISSPIFIDGLVWGTLNFTSLEQRNTPFSAEEISFNERQAARIAQAIVQAGHQ